MAGLIMGHLTHDDFERILSSCADPPLVYIETGCNSGDQLLIAAAHFRVCVGIELDQAHHAIAVRRARRAAPADRVIDVLQGDTVHVLPRLLECYADLPVFFMLDAHFCVLDPPVAKSPFPLWTELAMLRARTQRDVIVVDDVHTFGARRDDLRFGSDPEWETVTEASISAFLGAPGTVIGDGYVVHR